MQIPLLSRLADSRSILLVGAGGGFDVAAGIPLFHHLRNAGKQVHLASLDFRERPALAEHLGVPIHGFVPGGAQQILKVYQDLAYKLQLDALVLVDGGTDSLLRGDEPGLGSPGEDIASLAAAFLLELPTRLLVSLGFGVDVHDHVCHAYVLEAAADLTRCGGFLGAFSLLPEMPEFQAFARTVRTVCGRSVVATSVVAAGEGYFGDHHSTPTTQGSRLFINPLMSMMWAFEVDALARRCLYMERVLGTRSRGEVTQVIQEFRSRVTRREWQPIPL